MPSSLMESWIAPVSRGYWGDVTSRTCTAVPTRPRSASWMSATADLRTSAGSTRDSDTIRTLDWTVPPGAPTLYVTAVPGGLFELNGLSRSSPWSAPMIIAPTGTYDFTPDTPETWVVRVWRRWSSSTGMSAAALPVARVVSQPPMSSSEV